MYKNVQWLGVAVLVAGLSSAAGCAYDPDRELERQTALAEKREQYALERKACEESARGAWMCTEGSKRSQEEYPWLHCGCADNRRVLD
ncbi:MAG: hypothetical protein AAFX10_05185 [Pseudomonadota bacterium]